MTLVAACWVVLQVATGVVNGSSKPLRAAGRAKESWLAKDWLGPEQNSSVEGKTTGEPEWEVIGEIKFNQVANHPGACAELSEKNHMACSSAGHGVRRQSMPVQTPCERPPYA